MNDSFHAKATVYLANDLWAYDQIEVKDVTWRFEKYAQFSNAARVEYTIRGKRKRQKLVITTVPLIAIEGWGHPAPPPKFGSPERAFGSVHLLQKTRFPGGDQKWHVEFNAFISEYLARSNARVLLDLRMRDPKISNVGAEVRNPKNVVQNVSNDLNESGNFNIDGHEFGFVEGGRMLVLHLRHERSQVVVRNKKMQASSLDCEICRFSFQRYGNAAGDYCEVHHLSPLSEVESVVETRMEDLAILCANCHRVVHLRNPPFTLDEVRAMLDLAKSNPVKMH